MKKVLNYQVVSVTNYLGKRPVSVTTIFYNRRAALKQYGYGVKYYSTHKSQPSDFGVVSSVHLYLCKCYNEDESDLIMEQVFTF